MLPLKTAAFPSSVLILDHDLEYVDGVSRGKISLLAQSRHNHDNLLTMSPQTPAALTPP